MKIAATLWFILLAVSSTCQATIPNDFLGTWRGNQNLTYQGQTIRSTFVQTARRLERRGAYSVGWVRIPGLPQTFVMSWNHDSGSVFGYIQEGSTTTAITRGRWTANSTTIVSTAYVYSLSGNYVQTTRTSLTSPRTTSTVSTTSFGAVVRGTASK